MVLQIKKAIYNTVNCGGFQKRKQDFQNSFHKTKKIKKPKKSNENGRH